MGKKKSQIQKIQSMKDNSKDSLNSTTGYQDTGNDAQVQARARAIRTNDNGAHWIKRKVK